MKIGIFIPCYGERVHPELIPTVLADYTWCLENGHEARFFWHSLQPVDRARNKALERARNDGCRMVYMLDADTWVQRGVSALGALFETVTMNRATAAGCAVVCRDAQKVNVAPVKAGEVYEAEKIGSAVLLVDIVALDRMGPGPWFRYLSDEHGNDTQGEDMYFCAKVRRLGGTVWCNFQVQTRHLAQVGIALEQALAGSRAPERMDPP